MKCKWVYLDGRKCRQSKLNNKEYCKRHDIDQSYIYSPDGLKNKNGELEGCGHVASIVFRPITTKQVENHSEYSFISKGANYDYHKSTPSGVFMKDVTSDESILFWKDKETRKGKSGPLLSSLKTEMYEEYCDEIAICFIEEKHYCEKCFKTAFRCRMETLVPTNTKYIKEDSLNFQLDKLKI